MSHETEPQIPFDTEYAPMPINGSIAELVDYLEGSPESNVTEIPVWGVGTIDVVPGEIGAIHTAGLNGCHVSVMSGLNAAGQRRLAMTHFPPEFAKGRYQASVRKLAAEMDAEGVRVDRAIAVVDRSLPRETDIIAECFPDAALTAVTYDRRATGRGEIVDKGNVLAMVDFRNSQYPELILATETGIETVPLAST